MFTPPVSSGQEEIKELRQQSTRCKSVLNIIYRPVCRLGQFGINLLESVKTVSLFLGRFCMAPTQVGSICPSSKYLVSAMVTHALPKKNNDERGRHILEVGPGTGPITAKIVARLAPNDRFDLVEYDPTFADALIKRYQNDPRIHVHTGCFIAWASKRQKTDARYDVVISGLPLNIFPVKQAQDSLAALKRVTSLEGSITYFEYPEVAAIKKLFLFMICASEAYQRAEQIEKAKRNFCAGVKQKKEKVCANFPPALVVHLQFERNLFAQS